MYISLKAIPAPGFCFDNWSGDLTGTENPKSLYITYNSRITANFSPIVHAISLAVDGSGSIKPAAETHEYNEGDVVTITAIPDKGWQFGGWSGDVVEPQSAVTTIIVSSDKTVTANFSPIAHTISLAVDGSGSTKPTAGTHEYNEGDVITIRAITDKGWQFDGWRGDVAEPQSAVTTVIVSLDKTVTATFSPIVHAISLAVDGSGSIKPAAGTYEYNDGDVVTITATPDKGWQFDGWRGDVAEPQSAVTTVIVSLDKTVTATFSPIVHAISLEVDGSGSTKPAAGTHEYNEGDTVSITALPDEGWQFDGWSSDVTNPKLTMTTIIVSSDKTVTANFSQVEPGWWQALRTLYDKVLAKLRLLGNLFPVSAEN